MPSCRHAALAEQAAAAARRRQLRSDTASSASALGVRQVVVSLQPFNSRLAGIIASSVARQGARPAQDRRGWPELSVTAAGRSRASLRLRQAGLTAPPPRPVLLGRHRCTVSEAPSPAQVAQGHCCYRGRNRCPTAPRPGVPLCDLQAQYRSARSPQIDAAVVRVSRLRPGDPRPGGGRARREVARYCGAGHAVGCGSGTDALLLALRRSASAPATRSSAAVHLLRHRPAPCVRRRGPPRVRRHRPGHVQPRPGPGRDGHAAHAGDHAVHLFGQCADMDPLATSPSGTACP